MWLTTFDLLKGYNGYPSISLQTQSNLRMNGKIKYIKLGRSVYYKKEWLEDYINSQIRPAKTSQEDN